MIPFFVPPHVVIIPIIFSCVSLFDCVFLSSILIAGDRGDVCVAGKGIFRARDPHLRAQQLRRTEGCTFISLHTISVDHLMAFLIAVRAHTFV